MAGSESQSSSSSSSSFGRRTTGEEQFCLHIEGLHPQLSWRTLKDRARSLSRHVTWTWMSVCRDSRPNSGQIRLQRCIEAEALFAYLVHYGLDGQGLYVFLWDIATLPPTFVRSNAPRDAVATTQMVQASVLQMVSSPCWEVFESKSHSKSYTGILNQVPPFATRTQMTALTDSMTGLSVSQSPTTSAYTYTTSRDTNQSTPPQYYQTESYVPTSSGPVNTSKGTVPVERRSIFLEKVDCQVSAHEIQVFCESPGGLDGWRLASSARHGTVKVLAEYSTVEAAMQALAMLHNKQVGGRAVQCRWAKDCDTAAAPERRKKGKSVKNASSMSSRKSGRSGLERSRMERHDKNVVPAIVDGSR